ncbi:MAG: oligosaccharide flippase family protein [Chlorobium sp.]|nr:oligosaccharide flippase family protein [Chlorobium sp.]
MAGQVVRRSLIKDGAWVSIGQIFSAAGTLIGIRILTEFVDPELFGAVTLIIGIVALALGTMTSPVMQAALKFYPEYSNGRLAELRSTVYDILIKRIVIFLSLVALATPIGVYYFKLEVSLVALCALLLIVDSMRSFEMVMLNASRKHTAYALISVGEAWGRPIAAGIAVYFMGAAVKSILMAYAIISGSILLCFYIVVKPHIEVTAGARINDKKTLKNLIHQFSLPLVPMSALGWMNGVGDRYLIGGLLGLEQAGVYAAVYGLMSRPFLISSGIVELTLRPLYNKFVAQGKDKEAQNLLMKWLLSVALITGAGFAAIALFDDFLISVLLAEKYRGGVTLMLWIAAGYVFLSLSDVFVKVCYAYGYTRRILVIQVVGAVLSMVSAVVGIKLFGLLGAAMAVPAYFGIMLIITIFVSKKNVENNPCTPSNDQ